MDEQLTILCSLPKHPVHSHSQSKATPPRKRKQKHKQNPIPAPASAPIATPSPSNAVPVIAKVMDKKTKRKIKKAKKLITEFELARSNDAVKRPGELLDHPTVQKKSKDEEVVVTTVSEPANSKTNKFQLNPAEFKELKQHLANRKRFLTSIPRFLLQYAGMSASLSKPQETRVPILVSDIQQLLLYALGGNSISHPPERWCCLQKYTNLSHIVVLILEGLSCDHFFTYEHLLPKLTAVFPERVEVMSPHQYGNDVAQEMACVALSQSQKQKILERYGTLEAAIHSKEVFKVFRSLFPINYSELDEDFDDSMNILSTNEPELLPSTDMFPRTYLLLSLQQMVLEDYPLPFEFELPTKYAEYKMTKNKYKEVSVHSPIFALDCEMCMTDTNTSELTRIAVVDENHKVLYESLVKPKNKIINYLTEYSGITKQMLDGVTTTLEDVQKALRKLLPEDAILIGHSLNCDLHAVKMIHPYVIDTSVVFNTSGIRNKKPKLSYLVDTFLGESIQSSERGHCPVEDATGTMKLVQLKLSKGFRFGDALIADDPSLVTRECQLTASIFNQTSKANKSVSVIAFDEILDKYKNYSFGANPGAFQPIPISKSTEVVQFFKDAAINNDMSLGHLDMTKELKKKNVEEVMTEVDSMCESVFSHVSQNGLFVMLFTGNPDISKVSPPKVDENEEEDTAEKNGRNGEKEENSSLNSAGNSSAKKAVKFNKLRTHRNGVCFIRVNARKY